MISEIRTVMRAALGTILIAALGACWGSEKSLFLPQDSVTPLPGGTYDYHLAYENEVLKVSLIPFPGGGYIYTTETEDDDEEETPYPLLVYRVDENWHILQLGGDFGTMIGLAHTVDERIDVYDPECEPEIEAIEGASFNENSKYGNECMFDNLGALLAATRLVIDRIEAGEHESPVGWFNSEPVKPML